MELEDDFCVIICMGAKKHEIKILKSMTLSELKNIIESTFSVHSDNQKLIYKGKLLNGSDFSKSFSELNIKKGDTIMVLGKKRQDHPLFKVLEKYQSEFKNESKLVKEIHDSIKFILNENSLLENKSFELSNSDDDKKVEGPLTRQRKKSKTDSSDTENSKEGKQSSPAKSKKSSKKVKLKKDNLDSETNSFSTEKSEKNLEINEVNATKPDLSTQNISSVDENLMKNTFKRFLVSNEKLLKLLENLDGIDVTECTVLRTKRKQLVHEIQKVMDEIDLTCDNMKALCPSLK